ncbi:MAG: NUDIX domain-containing protein [Desulfotignum sp.]|nr:NUDIX domain-containing protein [Desulfotignum sp.]MCF8089269.1 NUDIX domain-containing protein [Desulfotignum sp.]MCF8137576.1 NUDIX domain-containing protein [Desulfotignum sp.]
MIKNHLHVTCAIIEQDGCVLAAQRSLAMAMPLKWEFPGGKIKPGETPEHCLCREIAEELAVKVAVHHARVKRPMRIRNLPSPCILLCAPSFPAPSL